MNTRSYKYYLGNSHRTNKERARDLKNCVVWPWTTPLDSTAISWQNTAF